MPDDAVTLPGAGADVAVDDVAGKKYQLMKLVDATEDSIERTGISDNPLVVSDSLSQRTTIALTGPSDGTWGEDIDCRGAQWIVLRIESMDVSPGAQIYAFGAPVAGGDYNQQCEWIQPDALNRSSIQRSLDPNLLLDEVSTTVNFAYLATPPPFVKIVGSGFASSDPVVAWLDLYPFPAPIVRTVNTDQPVSWAYAVSPGNAHVPLNAFTESDAAGTAKLAVSPATRARYLLDGADATGAGGTVDLAAADSMHGLQVTLTGSPSAAVVTLEGSIDASNWVTLLTWDSDTQASGDIVWTAGKTVGSIRANLTTLTGGTSPTVTAVWVGMAVGGPDLSSVVGGGSGDTELTTQDYDTGGGTDTVAVTGILLPKSGGAVAGGTSTDPLRTDPTGTTAQPVTDNGGSFTVDDGGGSITVDGTVAVSGTTAVSAAALPLPSGASTAAKQPALGTAGTASADVLSVQGIASMTALKVDGSAVTQPVSDGGGSLTVDGAVAATQSGTWNVDTVSTVTNVVHVDDNAGSLTVDGTVTANAGTNLNTSALATESGGNLAAAAASLSVLDDWDETDRAKVNPIVGQAGVQGASGAVSATTQRVVLATDVALPAGTNAIGKLAANSGVDIGDVDVTSVSGTVTVGGVAATDAAVSGNPVLDGGRASAATPTAMSADGDAVPLWTDRRGALNTVPGAAGGSATTGVAAAATSASILAANTSRKGVTMHNNSTATLYIKFGGAASIASGGYGVPIGPGAYWEMPLPIDQEAIHGIWSAANGYVNIVELT